MAPQPVTETARLPALARVRDLRAAERLLHADLAALHAVADRRLSGVLKSARTVEPYRSLWAGAEDEALSSGDLASLLVMQGELRLGRRESLIAGKMQ